MNLRRFWISAGAITTFVVGVSFVAYATGKFTSEASWYVDEIDNPDSGAAVSSGLDQNSPINYDGTPEAGALTSTVNENGDPIPDMDIITGTGDSPPIDWSSVSFDDPPIPDTVISAADVQRIGAANDAAREAEAIASAPGATAADQENAVALRNAANQLISTTTSSSAATKGKTLKPIEPAPAVQLQSFLQTNFASVDSILRIGVPRLLISFAGLIALVFFLINAVKFLFGAGNEKSTTEGKQGMAFAGIGLAIVIAAYLLVTIGANIFK